MNLIVRMLFAFSLFLFLGLIVGSALSCSGDDDDPSNDDDDDDNDNDDNNDDTSDDDDNDDTDLPVLKVGFARVDVTPDHSVIMGGYGVAVISDIFCRWSSGIHDPIYATAVAFEHPDAEPVILVHLDVVGVMLTDTKVIQAGVANALAIPAENILLASSHSHGSPDTLGLWGVISPPQTGRDDEFIAGMIDGAIAAGITAYESLVPANLTAATGIEDQMHYNPQLEVDQNAVLDSAMTILIAYDENEKIIGTLINWGCHPMIMGPQNKQLTSDFPGAYYRFMDAEVGGVNMFVNSTLGGAVHPQNPFIPFKIDGNSWGSWEDIENFGRVLADDAKTLINIAHPLESYEIKLKATTLPVQVQNPLWIANELVPREVPPWMGWVDTKVTAFSIGEVRFGTVPGELVPDIGLELREIMGGAHQFSINLGMDWFGYILTKDQFYKVVYIYYSLLCIGPGMEKNLIDHYHSIFDGWDE